MLCIKGKNLLLCFIFLLLLTTSYCSNHKDAHAKVSKTDDKKLVHLKDKHQQFVHNDNNNAKPTQDKTKTNNGNYTTDNDQDDYETNQGFPILYPETHMSMKRNKTIPMDTNVNTSNSRLMSSSDSSDETITKESMSFQNKTINNMTTTDEQGKCQKTVDLLFLLDSSESVKYQNWKIMMNFVKDLCNRFQMNSTRFAFMRFASEPEISVPLTQFNSTEERDDAIDNIFYKTGGTRTDIALKKASEVFTIGEKRSQVLMLLTDGPTNRLEISKDRFVEGKDLVAAPAERLKEAGIALFCIGIEPDSETPQEIDTMKDEMTTIASEPTKQHLFMSDGYHELQRKVASISQAACVVNGAWSHWSEFSPCSVTCSYGTRVRMRTCTNPNPENNGAECTGPRVEDEECYMGPCKIGQAPVVSSTRPPATTATSTTPTSTTSTSPNTVTTTATTPTTTTTTTLSTTPSPSEPPPTNATTTQTNNESKQPIKTYFTSSDDPKTLVEFPNAETKGKSLTETAATNTSIVYSKHSESAVDKAINSSKQNVTEKKEATKPAQSIQTTSAITHTAVDGSCYEGLEELQINDAQFSASSVYTHDTDDDYVKREYAPQNARLNNEINGGGWCAEHKYSTQDDKNQYIQLDLGKLMTIDCVATQGSHLLENWVKKYNIRYSDDGRSWQYYTKNPMTGNTDQNTVQRNMLSPPITGRFIQLNPIEWNQGNEPDKHDICMRVALFKCRDGAVAPPVKRGFIPPPTRSHKRGTVIKERASWSHFPEQKTHMTLLNEHRIIVKSETRNRREDKTVAVPHKKGNKRIFSKIRKIAKNIMRKLKNRQKSR